jgi:hypothetical protein
MVGFAHESPPSPRLSHRKDDAAYNVDRAAQQRHRGFERAKAGMGSECDVVHGGKRVIG